ncbi:BREX-1 system adenine-specific DNA-methyltransferase PglX [Mycolicibacterium sp. S3B2]|uniref:BREX-1 system adenine-specific DNA-methyltransferase PglX n=1 Tax=Mycolicibacterium sp. S3B2 TaxID=3415120 RepID=UPI003C7BAAFA
MRNIAALKGFAVTARTTLIEQMRVRLKRLLADPKAAAEFPRELARLREAVDAHSEAWVVDTAAYTWFNRITAARYMDANGFSGLYGVVTPEQDSASTLPAILTRAQAGEFPDDMPGDVRLTVMDLLSGRRASTDPDAEAYTLLLGAVFRTWHQPVPEVFPAAIDWVRLLTPPDILTPTSVRALAVTVMDDEACNNVEVVGWLYQFYNSELKEQINDAKVPIDAGELPAVTQLFTPHWIVRYLVENSLGRLWLRSRPSSKLRDHMPYYIELVAGQEDTGITVNAPEEIRLLDPACGSGHMLTYAFDLLYKMYEEEGHAPSSIPELILTHNLRGLEIDERAAQLASFALAMKARDKDRRFFTRGVQPDIVHVTPVTVEKDEVTRLTGAVAPERREALTRLLYAFADADTFGSLIRVDADAVEALESVVARVDTDGDVDLYAEHALEKARMMLRQGRALVDHQYHVVVANPPYLGSRNMGAQLSTFGKEEYPQTKRDLYAMFIERNVELALPAGSVAMVTMHSWMFLSSYAEFRMNLLRRGCLSSMAHLGSRAFDSITGEVVKTTAFVLDMEPQPARAGIFLRLTEERNEADKDSALRCAVANVGNPARFAMVMNDFAAVPDSPIVYWLSDAVKAAFAADLQLAKIASLAVGLQTGDNDRFLRLWFEVANSRTGFGMISRDEAAASGLRWFPYNKGGGYRKWWGNQEFVVNWENGGKELLEFRPRSVIRNPSRYFEPSISWSDASSSERHFRRFPPGFLFDVKGMSAFPKIGYRNAIHGLLNSVVCPVFLAFLSPTLSTQIGDVGKMPLLSVDSNIVDPIVDELVDLSRRDWDDYETSWDFDVNPLVAMGPGPLEAHSGARWDRAVATALRAQQLEQANSHYFAKLYELEDEVSCDVPPDRVSLTQNPYFRYAPNNGNTRSEDEYRVLFVRDLARELISYAVGVMVGRYSLDKPGLILADAGATISDFDGKVPNAGFRPDPDGILPVTAEHYFEDDIVARLRQFLSAAFGSENVEANIAWLEHALGSGKRRDIRDYFLSDFFGDHVKTYSKRPIYWQVSSPKGGFNALFYLHRYSPATLGLIHQGYAEDVIHKIEARLATIEHALPTAEKREATRLGKERDTLAARRREIRDWIDDALFPLATAEVDLDLDDGVKQNYPKLHGVVKKVTGL